MDFTTNKLILVGYSVLALLVGVIGFTFVRSQSEIFKPSIPVAESTPTVRTLKSGANSTALSKRLQIDIRQQRDRITELQDLLARREAVLRQQADQIETQTTASRRLQAEADRYLELLTTAVQESVDSIDENLNLLESADATAEGLLETQQPPTYETLDAALHAAQWELDQTQAIVNESEIALAEQVQRTLILRQAIVDAGATAVPLLVNMLSGDDNELRAWSAGALGRVAGESPVAIDALLVAAEDPDEGVRMAAQSAIQDISEN